MVRWFSVRLLLILSIVNKWYTTQIDYVLVYPQAPIERKIFMEIETQKKKEIRLCIEAASKHIWSETSRKSMVQILTRKTYLNFLAAPTKE